MKQMTYEKIPEGYRVWYGEPEDNQLKAVVTTSHHQNMYKNNQVHYELMPTESWSIHFTSPAMPVDVVNAIMSGIPKEWQAAIPPA